MKDDLFLPDTSAILTMMDNEEGAEVVENILRTKEIVLPAIVLLEVYYTTIQHKNIEVAELRYATARSIKASHVAELSEPLLLKAGELKANFRISLADSIIAACAFVYDATLVHKDPEFEALEMIDQVKLPYKRDLTDKVS